MAKILFSPVGGTDPISLSNMRDGSLLHICRFYRPDLVILYMSKEVIANEKKDQRYSYCLNQLKKLTNQAFEIRVIQRPDLVNVHEFDYFYTDFRQIIKEIFNTMTQEDVLYLNVSSGTPAMKSALLVLQTLGEFNSSAIQVRTPVGKMNEHIHEGYEVVDLWDCNEDNEEGAENRCSVVQCPTLSEIQKEQMIKKHLLAYDYAAAVSVAETLPAGVTQNYMQLLQMAAARVQLDFAAVDRILAKEKFDCLPVKDSNKRKYMEYGLGLDLKLKRAEYVDFIRAITPLIVDLFELVLEKQFGWKLDDYTSADRNGVTKWNEIKMLSTPETQKTLDILHQVYGNEFKANGPVYSVHLMYVICELTADDRLKMLVKDLRLVEEKVRNIAAHEIVSITDAKIRTLTGFTSQQIMQKIKNLYSYTSINAKTSYWNSYDEMNENIISRM